MISGTQERLVFAPATKAERRTGWKIMRRLLAAASAKGEGQ